MMKSVHLASIDHWPNRESNLFLIMSISSSDMPESLEGVPLQTSRSSTALSFGGTSMTPAGMKPSLIFASIQKSRSSIGSMSHTCGVGKSWTSRQSAYRWASCLFSKASIMLSVSILRLYRPSAPSLALNIITHTEERPSNADKTRLESSIAIDSPPISTMGSLLASSKTTERSRTVSLPLSDEDEAFWRLRSLSWEIRRRRISSLN